MLYNMTKKDIYKTDLEQTFTNWLPTGTGSDALPYTPKGLAFRLQWGSLRYACEYTYGIFTYMIYSGDRMYFERV